MAVRRAPRTISHALRRAGVIVTALVALACTLSVQTGEAAVAHVRCVEHGELTHVRALVASGTARPTATHLAAPRGTQQVEHEHCLMTAASHCIQLATGAPATALVATVAIVRSVAPPDYLARAPLRYAPKTSPPSRAG